MTNIRTRNQSKFTQLLYCFSIFCLAYYFLGNLPFAAAAETKIDADGASEALENTTAMVLFAAKQVPALLNNRGNQWGRLNMSDELLTELTDKLLTLVQATFAHVSIPSLLLILFATELNFLIALPTPGSTSPGAGYFPPRTSGLSFSPPMIQFELPPVKCILDLLKAYNPYTLLIMLRQEVEHAVIAMQNLAILGSDIHPSQMVSPPMPGQFLKEHKKAFTTINKLKIEFYTHMRGVLFGLTNNAPSKKLKDFLAAVTDYVPYFYTVSFNEVQVSALLAQPKVKKLSDGRYLVPKGAKLDGHSNDFTAYFSIIELTNGKFLCQWSYMKDEGLFSRATAFFADHIKRRRAFELSYKLHDIMHEAAEKFSESATWPGELRKLFYRETCKRMTGFFRLPSGTSYCSQPAPPHRSAKP